MITYSWFVGWYINSRGDKIPRCIEQRDKDRAKDQLELILGVEIFHIEELKTP